MVNYDGIGYGIAIISAFSIIVFALMRDGETPETNKFDANKFDKLANEEEPPDDWKRDSNASSFSFGGKKTRSKKSKGKIFKSKSKRRK